MGLKDVHDSEATKAIGGQIPETLYWEFKEIQAQRRESSTKALEIAIRLYCDAVPTENSNEEGVV